ncbi:hypothetical protein RND81_10G027000 [Saponaria officinalis]|uniref:Uncharacterized protein n=1 Tax=Saponaria officinalis TaxID=3572 RepID=A0AAW1HYE3_SAPOF
MGRAPCCDKDGLKKGPWLPEEDQKLVDYIHEHGPGNWRALPKKAGLQRCGKSCRLRWTNYLRPDIKRGRFTFEEEEAIIQLHSVLGNKWSAIAAKLPGRTDNEIKNYWNTHIRKRLLRMGIDPVTHTRRFDLLDHLPSILNSPLQNSSQINLLKLLSFQTLINPDLLKLATFLSSNPNPDQNPNFLLPNFQTNDEFVNTTSSSIQNHYHQMTQPQTEFLNNIPACTTMTTNYDTINFEPQNNSLPNDHWQSNNVLLNQYVDNTVQQGYNGQFISNGQIVNDDFLVNAPGLSTPGTSEDTPLNSNSEFVNSSICSGEDEIDSYCRNLMNLDVLDDLLNNVC